VLHSRKSELLAIPHNKKQLEVRKYRIMTINTFCSYIGTKNPGLISADYGSASLTFHPFVPLLQGKKALYSLVSQSMSPSPAASSPLLAVVKAYPESDILLLVLEIIDASSEARESGLLLRRLRSQEGTC